MAELVLARACARGNAIAWSAFCTLYRDKLYAAATAMTHDEARGRELADSLYAELYGTRTSLDGSRVSKLDSYAGRGSLEGWLKTILAQQFVNRLRSERKLVSFNDALETTLSPESELNDPSRFEKPDLLTEATSTRLSADWKWKINSCWRPTISISAR